MNKLLQVRLLIVIMGILLSACGPLVRLSNGLGAPTVTPTTATATYVAQVDGMQVQVTAGDPPQAVAVVRGMFSESCATLGPTQVEYSANTFRITVYAVSPIDRGCAAATEPYETTVPLDIRDLPAGDYTVTANGVSAVFTLKAAAVPTAAPTAVPTQASGGQSCTDAAAFVSDVSVPDNVLFAPGTPFTKTWRLKNAGTCAWTSDTLVYWISGATMSQQPGYRILQAGQRVEPGQSVDVSVGMTAPMETGYYTAYWGLKGRNGQFMPVSGGANGNSFFVKIRVSDSGSGGLPGSNIVDQSIDIQLEQGSGAACTPGATYLVHAYVSADGPLSALYEIDSTAGQVSAGYFVDPDTGSLLTTVEGTVTFDASLFAADGTHTITLPLRFVGPYPYPRDIQVNFWVDGGQWVSASLPCP